MKTGIRWPATFLLIAIALSVAPDLRAQWRWGGSTDFFAPVGDLSQISELGLSFDVYAGRSLVRKKLALTVDAGIHWFLPNETMIEDVPDWIEPAPDDEGVVSVSGSFVPIRGSVTLLFGRAYVSPRAGVYLPLGDFRKELDWSTRFGVAPRLGYFYPVTPTVQFDLAAEYDYLFGDHSLHYVGFSMGLFFGGRRLSRYY